MPSLAVDTSLGKGKTVDNLGILFDLMPNENFWVVVLLCDMFVQNLTIFFLHTVYVFSRLVHVLSELFLINFLVTWNLDWLVIQQLWMRMKLW